MLIDIHVHTKEHSKDARLCAQDIVRSAIDAGLDGVVFTDHAYRWTDAELAALRESLPPFLILSGAELIFDSIHMLVFNGLQGDLPRFTDPSALTRCAESRGGITVVAHAFSRHYRVGSLDILKSGAQGIEVYNARRASYEIRNVLTARELGLAELAGSDEHGPAHGSIGRAATFFPEPVSDSSDIVRQIRERKTRAWRRV